MPRCIDLIMDSPPSIARSSDYCSVQCAPAERTARHRILLILNFGGEPPRNRIEITIRAPQLHLNAQLNQSRRRRSHCCGLGFRGQTHSAWRSQMSICAVSDAYIIILNCLSVAPERKGEKRGAPHTVPSSIRGQRQALYRQSVQLYMRRIRAQSSLSASNGPVNYHQVAVKCENQKCEFHSRPRSQSALVI